MTKKIWRQIAALAAATMMSSCAHDPGIPALTQIDSHACAVAPDFAQPTVLVFDSKHEKTVEADIGPAAHCVFVGGKAALYNAFALPAAGSPYIVTVMATPQGGNLLAPQILLYGEDGSLRRSISGEAIKFRAGALSALFRSHADERYLVVASDPSVVGQNIARITEATNQQAMAAGGLYFSIYSGSDISATYTLSHVGHFSVTLAAVPAVK